MLSVYHYSLRSSVWSVWKICACSVFSWFWNYPTHKADIWDYIYPSKTPNYIYFFIAKRFNLAIGALNHVRIQNFYILSGFQILDYGNCNFSAPQIVIYMIISGFIAFSRYSFRLCTSKFQNLIENLYSIKVIRL